MGAPTRGPLVTAAAAGTLWTLLTAAGCGEPARVGGPSATGSTARPAASPTPGDSGGGGATEVTRVVVTVANGTARTASGRVKVRRGATVEITVTSDTADEFHLHGYDRTLALTPGRPATLRLVADAPGVFEAELHRSGARAFELQVS